jgi:hypothetical protein
MMMWELTEEAKRRAATAVNAVRIDILLIVKCAERIEGVWAFMCKVD